MSSNQEQLQREIIARSNAHEWSAARIEWELDYIVRSEEPETCLCGHHPIIELCWLRNNVNNNKALVGNVCVNRFMGLGSQALFDGLRRIAKDQSAAANEALIHYAYNRQWVTDWEFKFLLNTRLKRRLSRKQRAVREKVNNIVLRNVVRENAHEST